MLEYHSRPEWQSWLKAIRGNPSDDLARLVAADWLEDEGWAERAAVIRAGIEYAKTAQRTKNRAQRLRRRLAMRSYLNSREWICHTLNTKEWANGVAEIDRGFFRHVSTSFSSFLTHADHLLPESVGLTVRLTTVPDHPGQSALSYLRDRWPDVAEWDLPQSTAWLNVGTFDAPEWAPASFTPR